MFSHVVFAEHFPSLHSFTSVQVFPFPVKPSLQVHVYEPKVLLHLPFSEHGFTVSVHSSMSLHSMPSPENPFLQAHLYESSVSSQVALGLHV